MSQSQTPVWTDASGANIVVADAVLARGSKTAGTLDLRGKFGAKLFICIGRGGTAVLTNGVDVLIRALLNNGAAGGEHPASVVAMLSSIAAAASTTVSTDSNSGQNVLTVASGTGIVAGSMLCIQDSGGGVTRLEFQRVSKVSGGTITLDRNLGYTHTSAQADTVRTLADVFAPIWIDGGSLYEVIFDYGDDAAGDSVTVRARAQTYDSNLIA